LISGTLWGGKPGSVLRQYRQRKFSILISPFILAELSNFLEEYHIKKKERETILNEFKTRSIKIIPQKKVNVCRDKKDNQILALCLAGKADFLITGDKHLLSLKKFGNTKILKPKEFLKLL